MKFFLIASIASIVATFVLGFLSLCLDDDYLVKAFHVVKYFAIVGVIFLIVCGILHDLNLL